MKLSDQVCTLLQSERLKELGVRQDVSISIHVKHKDVGDITIFRVGGLSSNQSSAFTVAELGLMLPHPDNLSEIGGFLHPSDFDKSAKEKPWFILWEYDLDKENAGLGRHLMQANTEAEVRAMALIYMLDIGYITSAEVNVRLLNDNET